MSWLAIIASEAAASAEADAIFHLSAPYGRSSSQSAIVTMA
jgi:hypothetical protein